eukprot:203968_1
MSLRVKAIDVEDEDFDLEFDDDFASTPLIQRSSNNDFSSCPSPASSTDDVFEIEDFTTATEWESFISAIENQLHAWNLADNPLESTSYEHNPTVTKANGSTVASGGSQSHEAMQYTGVTHGPDKYILEWHYLEDSECEDGQNVPEERILPGQEYFLTAMRELVSRRRFHTFDGHDLRKWFGLSAFIVLRPHDNRFLTDSESRMMLSSLVIAADNANCSQPVFVPVGDYWRSHHFGRISHSGTATRFGVSSCQAPPAVFRHLAGIEEFFAEEMEKCHELSARAGASLVEATGAEACQMRIAASFTFAVTADEWNFDDEWRAFEDDRDISRGLAWGTRYTPLDSLILRTTWPFFKRGSFIENPVFSDMDPLRAPEWNIHARWSSYSSSELRSKTVTPLSDSLRRFMQLALSISHYQNWSDVLMAQVSLSPTNSNSPRQSPRNARREFSDAELERRQNAIATIFNDSFGQSAEAKRRAHSHKHVHFPRGAPLESLLGGLVTHMLVRSATLTPQSMSDLWSDFISELSRYWQGSRALPGVRGATPSFKADVVHQKLQLMQACMARRGGGKEEAKAGDDSTNNSWDEWEVDNNSPESEGSDTAWVSFGSCSSNEDKRSDFDEASETDEFFDAVERDEVDEEPCSLNFENAELVRNFRCWECEDGAHPKTPPVGILKEIPRLGLLNHPERRINVPVTQEHPLMTTDMLEKEQKRLENLGTSREASLLRAELQASHLLSDMCAFRAANPCCVLADFI